MVTWQEELDSFLRSRENLKKLRLSCAAGRRSLVIDFEKLLEFNVALVRQLIDNPAEFFKSADGILEQITKIPCLHLRVRGLEPALPCDPLYGLGVENIGKLVQVQDAVKDVGNVHTRKFVQIQGTVEDVKETQFTKDETRGYEIFEDYQMIKVGTIPVELTGDLVGTVQRGDRVVVTGTLKTAQALQQQGSDKLPLNKLVEASYVEKTPVISPTKETASLEDGLRDGVNGLTVQLSNKEWGSALRTLEYIKSIIEILETKTREW